MLLASFSQSRLIRAFLSRLTLFCIFWPAPFFFSTSPGSVPDSRSARPRYSAAAGSITDAKGVFELQQQDQATCRAVLMRKGCRALLLSGCVMLCALCRSRRRLGSMPWPCVPASNGAAKDLRRQKDCWSQTPMETGAGAAAPARKMRPTEAAPPCRRLEFVLNDDGKLQDFGLVVSARRG